MADLPQIDEIYNYEGDNYKVTRVEPGHFLVQDDEHWCDAIELTDHVAEGETATVLYVLPLDDFQDNYVLGEIVEGAAPDNALPEAPPEATQLPAEGEEGEAEAKG
jgi:hypothetical protein